jgi:hypothetical protein
MDKKLLFRMIDEIADRPNNEEPVQLHAMGEPLLCPHLFEAVDRLHQRGLRVRLFTNGALLNEKNRKLIFDSNPVELVIGIHTFNKELYNTHRRGKPEFEVYMDGIYKTIEEKFVRGSSTWINLQYLNTKHFNAARVEKGYANAILPLVDSEEKALSVIGHWKNFGVKTAVALGLDFVPKNLECLQGEFRNRPLDCLKGHHCEILPGVVLDFKDISSFADYLKQGLRCVERYKGFCPSMEEQLVVLSNGECSVCCVDYDGKLSVGSVRGKSISRILRSKKRLRMLEANRKGILPTQTCRICKAILVRDDYARGFCSNGKAGIRLEMGWYQLENDGENWVRWTGKRASLIPEKRSGRLVFEVKNGRQDSEKMGVAVYQGRRRRRFVLKGRDWITLEFPLYSSRTEAAPVFIEADEFWIPAEMLESNSDERELGLLVRSVIWTV